LAAPKPAAAKNEGAIAAEVRYGVNSRAELMGRAVGPVYNFEGSGAAGGRSARLAAELTQPAGAIRQVDAAQAQIDASALDPADKAAIDSSLDSARRSAAGAQ
jgi:hypothetical protein